MTVDHPGPNIYNEQSQKLHLSFSLFSPHSPKLFLFLVAHLCWPPSRMESTSPQLRIHICDNLMWNIIENHVRKFKNKASQDQRSIVQVNALYLWISLQSLIWDLLILFYTHGSKLSCLVFQSKANKKQNRRREAKNYKKEA
jgi:hypothetical protein